MSTGAPTNEPTGIKAGKAARLPDVTVPAEPAAPASSQAASAASVSQGMLQADGSYSQTEDGA